MSHSEISAKNVCFEVLSRLHDVCSGQRQTLCSCVRFFNYTESHPSHFLKYAVRFLVGGREITTTGNQM